MYRHKAFSTLLPPQGQHILPRPEANVVRQEVPNAERFTFIDGEMNHAANPLDTLSCERENVAQQGIDEQHVLGNLGRVTYCSDRCPLEVNIESGAIDRVHLASPAVGERGEIRQ